jgi:hypothetical protein
MRRPLFLAAVLLLAGCGTAETEPVGPAQAAEPQRTELHWLERYPDTGPGLRFAVDWLEVRKDGWSASIAVTNATTISFELGGSDAELQYGLMLFASGDLAELEEAARNGTLPAPRLAAAFEPEPPELLDPNETWRTEISAPGALADGSYVRVSFGPLRAQGEPPEDMESDVVWITDHAYQL